ncbi:MAG: CoA-binding protein [Promethearchaeati archaeon SRVP18_Atabeyarchaeia-1]
MSKGNNILNSFFSPRSVLLVGASDKRGKFGNQVIRNLKVIKYAGKILPVHLSGKPILGISAYKDIRSLPEEPELAVVLCSPEDTVRVVKGCVNLGIKAIMVQCSGFSEIGLSGAKLEEEILRTIQGTGTRIIGPNTTGLTDLHSRFTTQILPLRLTKPGSIAFLAQSGGLSGGLGWWETPSCRFSKSIAPGNAADLKEHDILSYLGDDPDTNVIAVFLKTMRESSMLDILQNVCKKKPVIIHCTDKYWISRLEESGAIIAPTYQDLFSYAKLFSLTKAPLRGLDIALVSPSSGPIAIAVNSLNENGLKLAKMTQLSVDRLRNAGILRAENPVDLWPPKMLSGNELYEKYLQAIDTFVKDDNVGSIMILYEAFKEIHFDFRKMLKSIEGLDSKPVVMACIQLENNLAKEVIKKVEEFNIPVYIDDIHAAARSLRLYYDRAKRIGQQGSP